MIFFATKNCSQILLAEKTSVIKIKTSVQFQDYTKKRSSIDLAALNRRVFFFISDPN